MENFGMLPLHTDTFIWRCHDYPDDVVDALNADDKVAAIGCLSKHKRTPRTVSMLSLQLAHKILFTQAEVALA
jgi:hypothetical protein